MKSKKIKSKRESIKGVMRKKMKAREAILKKQKEEKKNSPLKAQKKITKKEKKEIVK